MNFNPNPDKNLIIKTKYGEFYRYPIKTCLIEPEDNLLELIKKYALPHLEKDDLLFISEKIVAVVQNRSYKISEIKPSKLAVFLSKFVYKNPSGIGLAMPETMQLAIEEAGALRILLASFCAVITKPLKIKGVFYMVAGDGARTIDGPVSYAIPPYNEYASKGPKNPQKVTDKIEKEIGFKTAIIDANDLGINILGHSKGIKKKMLIEALKDNPLGQSDESTPLGILRKK
ncbi:MAG: coenzyme F420-0:L-glutamate ligase [Patescibacteria group bacterium]|nr:coenzyme F420-0:L-glutamate ligase [Patescibacteria group bacterium]